jgi:quinol monooxygenase YgiN
LTGHFLFVETWKSADAAAAAGKALGREAFAPVMAALAAPPVTTQYDVH